jgi:phosphoribosylformylglycinamidine cyclo-ligase
MGNTRPPELPTSSPWKGGGRLSENRGEGAYEEAGVSIGAGEKAAGMMQEAVEATHGPEVISPSGSFAELYALSGYREPVLSSTIDGVGTKVLVAKEVGRYASLGADVVNHCANDVLATGARPIIFLDYLGTGRLEPEGVADVVGGAARACGELGISLVGGETAEMPGLYGQGDFEVVGCCIGVAERQEIITGERVEAGDEILGLASSGLHTNGYTLARKVISDAGFSYSDRPEALGRTLGEEYLEPHRDYVREISALRQAVEVRGMVHVTGGGLPGNLPRSLGGLGARVWAGSWEEPAVFGLIRSVGRVPEEEMRRVFNLGVGFCAVVAAGEGDRALGVLEQSGCRAWRVGEVVEGGSVEFT